MQNRKLALQILFSIELGYIDAYNNATYPPKECPITDHFSICNTFLIPHSLQLNLLIQNLRPQ